MLEISRRSPRIKEGENPAPLNITFFEQRLLMFFGGSNPASPIPGLSHQEEKKESRQPCPQLGQSIHPLRGAVRHGVESVKRED